MKTLTDLFDFSCCINLDRRPDRWKESIQEFNKWGLNNINRIPAIDKDNLPPNTPDVTLSYGGKGALGLLLTTLQILETAQENLYNSILIMEDDVYFTPEVHNIETLISYVPSDWDMLYIGGNHNFHCSTFQPIPVNEHVLKCQHTFTTHCYAIKSHMYPILTEKLSISTDPIDVAYTTIQKQYNAYSIHPSVAKQREGFSDIENKTLNYDPYII